MSGKRFLSAVVVNDSDRCISCLVRMAPVPFDCRELVEQISSRHSCFARSAVLSAIIFFLKMRHLSFHCLLTALLIIFLTLIYTGSGSRDNESAVLVRQDDSESNTDQTVSMKDLQSAEFQRYQEIKSTFLAQETGGAPLDNTQLILDELADDLVQRAVIASDLLESGFAGYLVDRYAQLNETNEVASVVYKVVGNSLWSSLIKDLPYYDAVKLEFSSRRNAQVTLYQQLAAHLWFRLHRLRTQSDHTFQRVGNHDADIELLGSIVHACSGMLSHSGGVAVMFSRWSQRDLCHIVTDTADLCLGLSAESQDMVDWMPFEEVSRTLVLAVSETSADLKSIRRVRNKLGSMVIRLLMNGSAGGKRAVLQSLYYQYDGMVWSRYLNELDGPETGLFAWLDALVYLVEASYEQQMAIPHADQLKKIIRAHMGKLNRTDDKEEIKRLDEALNRIV